MTISNMYVDVLSWLKYRKAKKQRDADYAAHQRLFEKTVTIHGRLELGAKIRDEDGLPAEIRRMYYGLVKDAPVKEWSMWN